MTKKLLITCKNLSKAFPGLDEEIINKLKSAELEERLMQRIDDELAKVGE